MALTRLQKLLSERGVASRRKAEDLIAQGKVRVNGHPAKLGDSADPYRDLVTVSGKKEVVAVKISPEAVDPDDVEMLEDLIVAATNEAFHQMEAESSAVMSELTGGLGNLGGLSF